VDNHVEPSKSAVNIQVVPLNFSESCVGLTINPRITPFYIPSSQASPRSFWSETRLLNHLLRFNPETNQFKTRESDEGLQTIQFPFIHQGHPKNRITLKNLTTFLQNRNSCSWVPLNVQAPVTDAVLVVLNVCAPAKRIILILNLLGVSITAMVGRI
jgi:hypothetical protein